MTTHELTIIETDQDFGPAMKALVPQRQKFVLAILLLGGRNQSEAAVMAGYSKASATSMGSQLMRDEKVIAAMKEESERRLKSAVITAVSTMVQICDDPMHKDRFKAAARILDHAGLTIKSEQVITVQHTHDQAGQIAQIREMAKNLGIDPNTLLAKAGVAIDAEFTVVEPEDDLSDLFG